MPTQPSERQKPNHQAYGRVFFLFTHSKCPFSHPGDQVCRHFEDTIL